MEEPPDLPSLLVANVIKSDREWDLDILHNLVPKETVEIIRAIPLSRSTLLDDNIFWSGTMDGSFTVKSAYQIIQAPRIPAHLDGSWHWIWKLQCAERIRIFAWLLVRGRLLTNSVRFARHMASSPTYPRCESSDETIIHLLRDCYYAKIVWGLLGFASSEFFALDQLLWLRKFSTSSPLHDPPRVSGKALFLSTIWLLWKDRNALVFRNHRTKPHELCSLVFQQAKYTKLAMHPLFPVKSRQPRWVSWTPPVEGWHKLNTDGSCSLARNSATAGGLIRDSGGNWVSGFIVNVGHASIFVAELWGLREGLRLCKALGIPRVAAEMDSQMAVRFINEGREVDNLFTAILLDIKSLMLEFEACTVHHILRERNAAADYLASLGHSSQPGLSILNSPPCGLLPILLDDQLGVCFVRS
ncbi:hypothetical protein SLA2020_156950 [Shorea laevis]